MAVTQLLSNINKSDTYPKSVSISAPDSCGMLILMPNSEISEQQLFELPTINVKIFDSSGKVFLNKDINLSAIDFNAIFTKQVEPYSVPIYDIPSDCICSITPIFDTNAFRCHNETVLNGNIGSFTTSETGIVDTNTEDYRSLLWETPTDTFDISISFDDSNISSGGSSGGGGGGTGSVTRVAVSSSDGSMRVTGSPITSSGTINISVNVDDELSDTSIKPVQNKIVTSAINDKLDIDDAVGKNTTGMEYTIDKQTVVAGEGAEIFNSYNDNKAVGQYSHAEGAGTTASGRSSHAEGQDTTASGFGSHAEGFFTRATGAESHAEGENTTASGVRSHAEGDGTIASSYNQHAQGKFNIEDTNSKYAFIIGNGTDDDNRSNAFAVDWTGKVYVNGDTNGVDVSKYAGKNVTGTEYTIDGQTVVAGYGAEIFNDYQYNKATGYYSHAEGNGTTASGSFSHSEGHNTTASTNCSHSEGENTNASGSYSHAEGWSTTASGTISHAEGASTQATGTQSHAEGDRTKATGSISHAEGVSTTASGPYTHAEGNYTTASGPVSHAEGDHTIASGNYSHAEGEGTIAASDDQHTQGKYNIEDTNSKYAFIIGNGTSDSNRSNAFAVDWNGKIYVNGDTNGVDLSKAVGKNVEGTEYTIDGQTVVAGYGAEIFNGYGYNKAVGQFSHAEGISTQAVGFSSHAEGTNTKASGNSSHAEGNNTQATGDYSHAEGNMTKAIGMQSHSEGVGTTASGKYSHAEGNGTTASGNNSHAEGAGTVAASTSQHAQGKFNIEDSSDKYAFIIGNGTDNNNRSNAFAVDWTGKIYVNNSENGIDLNQLVEDEDISGVPALTVTLEKQTAVTKWEIEGNTEQNGTPSVSNPVPIYGVGDKTTNLCSTLIDNVRINIYNGVEEYANDMKATGFIPVDFVTNQYYTPSFVVPSGTTNDTYISGYDENKNYLGRTTGGITSGQPMEFQGSVDTSAVKYIRVCANIQTQDIMLNTGDTALPYEPYGYKISIVVNESTIIPFYLDLPLYEGDYASFSSDGNSFVTRENGVIESYNGETIGNDYVSSTGELSTGAFVVYKLNHFVTTQTTLPGFQLRSGENTIDIDTDVTPTNLYISWAEISKVIQYAYISPNGDDKNDGLSISSPFATIDHALELGRDRILLIGGKYEQTIDLSKATGRHIQIESVTRDSRPVFVDPDCVLVESATLENGIYHATIDVSIPSGNAWIYQDDVPDLETTISDNERMPLQRGKSERCEDTKIERCGSDNLQDALDEITNAPTNVYKWYLDDTTLYFSAPNAPSEQNPICYSLGNGLFSNGDRSISLTINGIKCKYISLNVENLCDVSLADCQASNIYGWGAIGYSNTLNAKFLRCEASRCYINGNGDGFNADVSNTGEQFAKHYSATLVDCWSHDNCDDGYSNHRHAESTIIGGLFEYNGKGGLTSSYGEHCSCYNVYSRHNYSGFLCAGEVEQAEGGKYTQLVCYNCVSESNDRGGHYAGFVVKDTGNRMILIGCKSINNTNSYYVGQDATAKMTDCTTIGQTTLIDGYPENATVELTSFVNESRDEINLTTLSNELYRSKMVLPDSIDLDSVKTGGIYHGVNSTGLTAVHMPVNNGEFNFSLMVIESGEFIIQTFKQLNGAGDPNIYIRRFYIWNTGWDSWYKFTGVPV